MSSSTVVAQGPFFDDLRVGDVFPASSALTLTEGRAAVHQAITGDRLRLVCDSELSRRLTGQDRPVASPALVWDVAIGQSTSVTHHVVANLFYRGLAFRRMSCLGDTLRTRTQVVGLRQNSAKPGRRATGLAALRITTTDQDGRQVLDFWRCAMLPLRDQDATTGHADDMAAVGADPAPVPDLTEGWRLDALREAYPEPTGPALHAGQQWEVVGGDVVSSAPELARLTLNIARAHHDDAANPAGRVVYGGHTIDLALSQVVRAVPELVTVLSWEHCDHLGPVREGDTLTSTAAVERVEPAAAGCRFVQLRSSVAARSGRDDAGRPVLDWRFRALLP